MLDAKSERGAHQGVLAEAKPYPFATLDEVLARAEGKPNSLIIALDHITDPGNLGAIVRTAEVVGADGVLVAKRRSAAVTAAAYKSSAGALAHVLLAQEANLVRSLERCKKEAGFWVAGASEHASQTVWDAPLEGRVVLVMGSEGEGLARLTRETCDFLVQPAAGGQGRLAQRRSGRDRALVRVAATQLDRGGVIDRAHADRRRLQRHSPDAALQGDRRGRPRCRRGWRSSPTSRRSRTASTTRRSSSTGTTIEGSTGSRTRVAGVTVIFSRYGLDADSVIESLSRAAREAGDDVVVVTSDAQTQWTVLGGSVARMSSVEFAGEIRVRRGRVARARALRQLAKGRLEDRIDADVRERLSRWARGKE